MKCCKRWYSDMPSFRQKSLKTQGLPAASFGKSWICHCSVITASKRSLGQGNVFTGGPGGTGQAPPPPPTATVARGTHPTGMHFCLRFIYCLINFGNSRDVIYTRMSSLD